MARGHPQLRTVAYSASLGKGGPPCCTFLSHEEPILVVGVITPSPTGLVGDGLTSCMLLVRPSTASEGRDVASRMQFASHTIPFRNQAVAIAAVGTLNFEAQIPHEGPHNGMGELSDWLP